MVAQFYEQISGTVLRANDRGFVLSGRDGWLNVSHYAAEVRIPEPGAKVRVGLDKAGFVRRIQPAGENVSRTGAAPTHAPEDRESPVIVPAERDARIMRQAVLNTATAILTTHQRPITLADVLTLAGQLEGWVTR